MDNNNIPMYDCFKNINVKKIIKNKKYSERGVQINFVR